MSSLLFGFRGWSAESPRKLLWPVPDARRHAAAFWTQLVQMEQDGELMLRGISESSVLRHGNDQVSTFTGSDCVSLYVAQESLWTVDGTHLLSGISDAAVNRHGEALVIQDGQLLFYTSVPPLVDQQKPRVLHLPKELTAPPSALVAGASHFLVLIGVHTQHAAVLSFSSSDNRFGQLGDPNAPVDQLNHIDFFDGLQPTTLAAGDLHSAVITQDGALYVFGSDAKGQLGGTSSSGEPALVEVDDVDGMPEVEQPDFVSVGCGSAHTVAVTSEGQVWVTGRNDYGQLGLGDEAFRTKFTRCALGEHKADSVLCSRWTTIISLSS